MVATVGSISIDLSTNVAKFASGFKGAATTVERESGRMARSVKAAEASFSSLARAGLGGVVGGLGAREIGRYADAWTDAGNKIKAAGQVAGREGRSLSALNDIATQTRTGLTETVDLYAKLLRATGNVAKSEKEVALATEIVNKAFKAGGAAASEQAAGILQLGQALGSGLLQGDELRSLRENAPLLAQAIADEFKTTIGGLKELGAEGAITADRVFKAILKSQGNINDAFSQTTATLGDSITLLGNTLTETIGKLDSATGFTKGFTEEVSNLNKGIDAFVANPNLDTFLGVLGGRLIEGGLADKARDAFNGYSAASQRAAEEVKADIGAVEAKLAELKSLAEAGMFVELETDRAQQDLKALQSELRAVLAAAANVGGALSSLTKSALNKIGGTAPGEATVPNVTRYGGTTAGTSGTRTVEGGVGVTRYGSPLNDVEDQLERGNDYQEEANRYLDQLISEVQAGTRSINDLPQSIGINYNSIADAVRIGIISGMPRDESRQQYSISTGSGTAALERQIEELRLVQATVGSLASEQISQQIAQLELQLFRTQNPIGSGIGGGPYSGSVSYAGAFAEGGSFTVPGNQTGDTTNLLLRANGGEEVEVRPAGQSGSSIVINYTPDAFEPFSTSEQRARKIGDIITRATRRR